MDIKTAIKKIGLVFKGCDTCLQIQVKGGARIREIIGRTMEEMESAWEAIGSPDIEAVDLTLTERQLELLDRGDEAAGIFLSAVTDMEDILFVPTSATEEFLARAETVLGSMGIFLIQPAVVYDGDECWIEEKDMDPPMTAVKVSAPGSFTKEEREAAGKFLAEMTGREEDSFGDEALAEVLALAKEVAAFSKEAG